MNEKLFPVKYNDAFYEYVTDAPEGYCKMACSGDGSAIGSICCEVEKVKIAGKRRYRLCILTVGVLEEYRRYKLGSMLLESVMTQARKDKLAYVYLHVQSSNTAAKKFYLARGFQVTKLLRNYYSELDPPHCFVLRKQLTY
ncbi:Acetyltransferase (GNAT) family [Phytophthora palmivora]|uniref:Acetyltransferase (GNAT) family n=1 Tax=Phytophthora palmivora TaxID=4796 RepID=A0A2P4XY65_9STRA|nr:Acetyltransferase (GNAT) family [Phytophthora palmivora]